LSRRPVLRDRSGWRGLCEGRRGEPRRVRGGGLVAIRLCREGQADDDGLLAPPRQRLRRRRGAQALGGARTRRGATSGERQGVEGQVASQGAETIAQARWRRFFSPVESSAATPTFRRSTHHELNRARIQAAASEEASDAAMAAAFEPVSTKVNAPSEHSNSTCTR